MSPWNKYASMPPEQALVEFNAEVERLRAALVEARNRLRTIEPRRQDADSVRRINALLDGAA